MATDELRWLLRFDFTTQDRHSDLLDGFKFSKDSDENNPIEKYSLTADYLTNKGIKSLSANVTVDITSGSVSFKFPYHGKDPFVKAVEQYYSLGIAVAYLQHIKFIPSTLDYFFRPIDPNLHALWEGDSQLIEAQVNEKTILMRKNFVEGELNFEPCDSSEMERFNAREKVAVLLACITAFGNLIIAYIHSLDKDM